jgi:hypothetical protein
MIEVMIATAILVLGTVLIHESFLKTAELYGRYMNGMRLKSWMDEQIWKTREGLVYSEAGYAGPMSGEFARSGKNFTWAEQIRPLTERDLYSIRLDVSWNEGNRPVQLTREIYALKKDLTAK